MLIPAGETEYAKDSTFGYTSSDLRLWVSEKSHHSVTADDVASVDLATIRLGGPQAVTDNLNKLKKGKYCVVNAVSYRDMEVFVLGLIKAEASGKRFIYRTAASFVRVRGGIQPQSLLTAADLGLRETNKGGLIVAGSYIKRSSDQIAAVQSLSDITSLEVSVPMLLDHNTRQGAIDRLCSEAYDDLDEGKDVLIYTSRRLVSGPDPSSSLNIGNSVSKALVEIVLGIKNRPAWMIAKGGITSSDVATRGLDVRRARVMGQIHPGVPVWQTDSNSRWPGLVYVVFPGNVGGSDAIAEVIGRLRESSGRH